MNESPYKNIRFRGTTKKYFVHEVGTPRFNEIDAYKVLWNGHYVSYFENARLAFCRFCGWDFQVFADMGYLMPVVRYRVDVRKPVFLEDSISVAVRPEFKSLGYSSQKFEFNHLLLVGDEVRAASSVDHMFMEAGQGVPAATPQEFYNVFNPVAKEFDGLKYLDWLVDTNAQTN